MVSRLKMESWEKRIMSPVCKTGRCRGVGEVLSQCSAVKMLTSVGMIGVILENAAQLCFSF